MTATNDQEPAHAEWCEIHLGSPIAETFFTATSMSSVYGVKLVDGRRLAVKVRPGSPRVEACAHAQRLAASVGIDAPALVAGPAPLHDGSTLWATAEAWRDEGTPDLPADAPHAYARLLHTLVTMSTSLAPATFAPPPPWTYYDHGETGRVWPPAASTQWDPERDDTPVPGWLRQIAQQAQVRLCANPLPWVVGHSDLNGLNVRWLTTGAGSTPIVHDWDSMAGRPEAVLVGVLAANHVELPDAGAIATLANTESTIDAYETLRGAPFSAAEREIAWAAGVWLAAYNAAFEYLHGSPRRVAEQIHLDADHRLRLAGC